MVKGFGKAYIMEFHFQSRLPVLCLRKVEHMFHSLPSIGCKLVGPNEQTHRLLGIQILQCLALFSFLATFSYFHVLFFLPSKKTFISFGVLLHLPSTKTLVGPCQVFTVKHKISLLLTPSSIFKSSSRMNFWAGLGLSSALGKHPHP